MPGFALTTQRCEERALVVGNAESRAVAAEVLERSGRRVDPFDDPYAAMAEICRHPAGYRALVLCLNSLYREELPVIESIKRHFPHIEVWLAQTDGRAAALAEATRLGADGLVSVEGLHAFGTQPSDADADDQPLPSNPISSPVARGALRPADDPTPRAHEELLPEPAPSPGEAPADANPQPSKEWNPDEPLLTAEELRALLQEPAEPSNQEPPNQ